MDVMRRYCPCTAAGVYVLKSHHLRYLPNKNIHCEINLISERVSDQLPDYCGK